MGRSVMNKAVINTVTGLLLSLLLSLGMSASAFAAWDEAKDLVEDATQKMVELLSNPTLKEEEAFQELFSGVGGVLGSVVDFDRIARGVMAKHYRQANDDQRQRFSAVFRNTLVKTYAKALEAFDFERYEIIDNRKPSKKPNKQTVKVDVFGSNGTRYNLIYFLLNGEQGWKVTNVHLDGINLRQIFKNQFADAVNNRKGNIDQVIDEWASMVEPKPEKES